MNSVPPTPGIAGPAGFSFANGALSPSISGGSGSGINTGASTPLSGLGPGGVPLAHGAPQAASTIGNRPAIAGSSLYQACLNLRDRLWCVDGFGHAYLDGPLVTAALAVANPPDTTSSPSTPGPGSEVPSPSTPSGLSTPTGLGFGGLAGGLPSASANAPANNVSLDASEPVSKLWATFRLGTPLCALFNALHVQPIDTSAPTSTNGAPPTQPSVGPAGQRLLAVNNDLAHLRHNPRECKKLAAHFIMAVRKELDWGPDEIFSVSDLYLDDTNGFVKVVRTVSKLLDVFASRGLLVPTQDPAAGNAGSEGAGAAQGGLAWSVNELLNTERKYVQDLEAMQNYARALQTYNILPPDTIHRLFGNLNALVDVSRRFLISVEENARRPSDDQHFGHAVMAMESDFAVYEPFCANYSQALDTINAETPNMLRLKECPGSEEYYLTPNYELPSLLIKPVQRICKYPLLLEQIIKNTPDGAAHKEELLDGLHVVKRIAEKVNETQRMQENEQIVKELEVRVDDWKGHNVNTFGPLLLHEHFTVIKSETEREYYVYLFERILLCCKDPPNLPQNPKDKKKKDKKPTAPVPGIGKKEKTPLQLKGRIFTENMTGAYAQTKIGSVLGVPGGQYSLQIWWRNEHDIETLGLKCKNEEQLNKWKTAVNRLIDEAVARRKLSYSSANSMSPMAGNMAGAGANGRRLTNGSSSFPITPLTDTAPFPFRSGGSLREDMDPGYAAAAAAARVANGPGMNGQGQGGAASAGAAYGMSRFSQPAEQRERKMSMSQEAASRPRARTEDQDGATMAQWRSHSPNPAAGGRPPLPRHSGSIMANAMPEGVQMPPTLRKASSSRQLRPMVAPLQLGVGGGAGLRMMPQRMNTGDGMEFMDVATPSPTAESFGPGYMGPRRLEDGGGLSRSGSEGMAAYRNRSASNPQQYMPMMSGPAPPLPRQASHLVSAYGAAVGGPSSHAQGLSQSGQFGPGGAAQGGGTGAGGGQGFSEERRFSASSYSTIDSTHSGQSRPESTAASSASTFGMTASNGANGGIPQANLHGSTHSLSRSATPHANPPSGMPVSQAVKLIISHGDEKFTIVVLQSIGFLDLQDKVTKKLRLCSGRKTFPESGVRIRYVDEDGDVVAMNTDDDVLMAFDAGRKTRQDVTLIVS
ncbi:Guanine nucleotide exchange factor for Cdc42p [Tilletia horrida]|nr:Guanine nucleotide exchange factor for Cdc42p [Tilletia horrida]KAK0531856.1 Guanine nucleotide exchange factor for Cdc42p [Tilletia horrida]KAK0563985.1 Guanine nucleotide exchange factor for Cdc42p [Tilletia horrida]